MADLDGIFENILNDLYNQQAKRRDRGITPNLQSETPINDMIADIINGLEMLYVIVNWPEKDD